MVPALVSLTVLEPLANEPVSKELSSAVKVWAKPSWFVTVTVSPTLAARVAGENVRLLMVTVSAPPLAALAVLEVPAVLEVVAVLDLLELLQAAADASTTARRARRAKRGRDMVVGRTASPFGVARERPGPVPARGWPFPPGPGHTSPSCRQQLGRLHVHPRRRDPHPVGAAGPSDRPQGQGSAAGERGLQVRPHPPVRRAGAHPRALLGPGVLGPGLPLQPVRGPGARRPGGDRHLLLHHLRRDLPSLREDRRQRPRPPSPLRPADGRDRRRGQGRRHPVELREVPGVPGRRGRGPLPAPGRP